MARYEQLHVWQRSIDLVCEAYRISKKRCRLMRNSASPPSVGAPQYRYHATSPRAQPRYGRKELLRHLSIARGSLKEVEALLIILERLRYAAPDL